MRDGVHVGVSESQPASVQIATRAVALRDTMASILVVYVVKLRVSKAHDLHL